MIRFVANGGRATLARHIGYSTHAELTQLLFESHNAAQLAPTEQYLERSNIPAGENVELVIYAGHSDEAMTAELERQGIVPRDSTLYRQR